MKKTIIENIKTIIYALIIALIIRTFLFQPFYIPSSSMEPNLLVGDRLFVSKYSYGYSRHSFPFSPNFSKLRYFSKKPQRGDVIVFKTPSELALGVMIIAAAPGGVTSNVLTKFANGDVALSLSLTALYNFINRFADCISTVCPPTFACCLFLTISLLKVVLLTLCICSDCVRIFIYLNQQKV